MDCYILVFVLVLLQRGTADATCRFPGAPAHSRVTFSDETLAEGAVATYACERGFELLGPARRVCGHGSQWTPDGIPFCVLNVAGGKAPMQASTDGGGVPQRALDGSADTCSLTRPERVPWWYVNLLEPYMVQLVRLDFGKPCCGANKPAVIVVRVGNNRPDLGTNPVCNKFTGFIEEGQPLFLPCNPPMPGAFVSVHLETTASASAPLSICEAFVYTDQALPIERCPHFRDQPPGSAATYNGKCYVFYDRQPQQFREALAFCRSRGGTLVDESNPALQGFISWELWRRHRSDSSSQYWMGAVKDAKDPRNWRWVSGDDVTVSFWSAPGGGEDCARFDGSKGWLWADTDCQAKLNFICQHQPKACGRPEQPPNSTMTAESFEVGGSVEYLCDEGHLLVGPTVRTCMETGFYDVFPPVCKRIECGYPAEVAHGRYSLLNGTVSYLSHVRYTCEDGYEMVGRATLICDIDERWNGPPPKCHAVQCERPPAIANGNVVLYANSTAHGSVADYACSRGHRLHGAEQITCLATGQWDKPAPICKPEERTASAAPVAPTTSLNPPATTPPSAAPPASSHPVPTRTPRPRPPRPPQPARTTTSERPTPTKSYERPPERERNKPSDAILHQAPTSHVPHIIVASHPRENQIVSNGSNIRAEETPRVNVPKPVDGERRTKGVSYVMLLTLAAFGLFVFIVAIVTVGVTLYKRSRSRRRRYHQHASPDCNTVASLDSSSSESRSGLNRYYRQAWEELHESAGAPGPRHAARHAPTTPRRGEADKEGSELVVSDVYPHAPHHGAPHAPRDKRRHHHHHHHRDARHNHQHRY